MTYKQQIEEILEQVYLYGMNGGLGYGKFEKELSPNEAATQLLALMDEFGDEMLQALPKSIRHPLYGADVRTFSQDDRDKWFLLKGTNSMLKVFKTIIETKRAALQTNDKGE